MIGAGIILAAAISSLAMEQRDARAFVRNYPRSDRDNRSAAVVVELVIESDGKVRGCEIVSFVGDERLAGEQCRRLFRIRYKPAIGPDGRPILSKYRTFISLFATEGPYSEEVQRARPAPDLILTSTQVSENVQIGIDLLIDRTGAAKLCDLGGPSQDAARAMYVEAACPEAMKIKWSPLTDGVGEPVEHVVNMLVRFEPEPTA